MDFSQQGKPVVATATLHAINAAVEKDQGATFRGLLRGLMPLAEDAYRNKEEGFRSHLGASLIGRECERELWYSFRWVDKASFPGRVLRLFNRGHLEEPRMVALLRLIGCEVYQYTDGKQFRISDHSGHFGGSLDAVIKGLPECPELYVLGEFKTHGDKSFQKVKEEGVRKAKFEHYVQMQVYMGKAGLTAALYLAVNKNDDELYAELLDFDQAIFDAFILRARGIIYAKVPPKKLNDSPSWYKCKFCDKRDVCHMGKAPERNCRTCEYAYPALDGMWHCGHGEGHDLDEGEQLRGCEHYSLIPALRLTAPRP